MRIGICGMGHVGKAMERFFRRSPANQIYAYDKFIPGLNTEAQQDAVNKSDLTFVAVPTPSDSDGFCDTSEVENAVRWIETPICLKSTVVPGTVDRLREISNKRIAISPEYIGESPAHPWSEVDSSGFVILGGDEEVIQLVIQAYRTCSRGPMQIKRTTARSAELCKYMENCFLATKVVFVNQFFDIASSLDIDFEELRHLWLMDTRIGESHTKVTSERGFSGRCLPKDLLALITHMRSKGGAPLLKSIFDYNESLRRHRRASIARVPSSEAGDP